VVRAAGLAGDSKQYPSLGQWRRMFVDMASPALVAQALNRSNAADVTAWAQ